MLRPTHYRRTSPRRLHLLLDSYGYDGDRAEFGTVIARRARRRAEVMRQMADAGDGAAIEMLPIAAHLERAAIEIEALSPGFWVR